MQQVIHSFHRFIEHLLHSRLCEVHWVKMMNKAVFQAVTFEQEFPCPSLTSSRLGIFAKLISSIKKRNRRNKDEEDIHTFELNPCYSLTVAPEKKGLEKQDKYASQNELAAEAYFKIILPF